MAKMILGSLNSRWINMQIMSYHCRGRTRCSGRLSIDGRDSTFRRHHSSLFTLMNVPDKESLAFGNMKLCTVPRMLASRVHMTENFENSEARCKGNGLSSVEGLKFFTTNVTLNLTQQMVKVDGKELKKDQAGSSGNTADPQDVEFTDRVTSTVQGNGMDATIEATFGGTVANDLMPFALRSPQEHEGKWWQIPDGIADVLRLPADFEERLEVLFRSFGSQIDSRELLLRVLVHKSYYDQRVPSDIKDREYRKPQTPLFIDSGEVKEQYVDGLPLRTISCMTFGDAHGEVRSQLAILGDSVISLAVCSLLVHQHSSAGTITERKCQLVSNSNLSRVWRTLLGPREFVLSSGDSSSQPVALSRMMADSCEAYIGALYTEKDFSGYKDELPTALFIDSHEEADEINTCLRQKAGVLKQHLTVSPEPFCRYWYKLIQYVRNPVHALNVHSSTNFQVLPQYTLIGVDNKNTQHQVCRVRVYVKGHRMATGMGVNQKLAKVDAARKALEKWPTVFKVS